MSLVPGLADDIPPAEHSSVAQMTVPQLEESPEHPFDSGEYFEFSQFYSVPNNDLSSREAYKQTVIASMLEVHDILRTSMKILSEQQVD